MWEDPTVLVLIQYKNKTSTLGTWRPIVFNVLDEWIMSKCLKFAKMTDKFTKKNPLK